MLTEMTHESLHRPAEYSVDRNRVLKGSTVIAWLRRRGAPVGHRIEVVAVGGPVIGLASSPAEAMLMAVRHREAPRC